MERHVKAIHEGKKDLVECSVCQKKVARRNFPQHMVTHTNAVAAHCDICNKDFKLTSYYRVHCEAFAYEHNCVKNGNSEFDVCLAAISFQYLRFQNTAAR